MAPSGFSVAVRDELAHLPAASGAVRTAETAALLRYGGALIRRGGLDGVGIRVETTSPAVARRLVTALADLWGVRAEVEARRAGGLRPIPSYCLLVSPPAADVASAAGLLDAEGRPAERLDPELVRSAEAAAGYLRGAVLAAGWISAPTAGAHLEIRAPTPAAADDVVAMLHRCGARGARAGAHGDRWRAVVKSGADIGTVLVRLGAHASFLAWDAARLRGGLRGDANRAANADRANLARSASAATTQATAVAALLGTPAWDELGEELQAVALARLANPEASLAELGAMLEPPVTKATVHRRLARVEQLAAAGAP